MIELFNLWQSFQKRRLPKTPLIAGGRPYPFVSGKLEKGDDAQPRSSTCAPATSCGSRAGRRSRPPSIESNYNRGLSFDGEMVSYCGRTARVRARVNRLSTSTRAR